MTRSFLVFATSPKNVDYARVRKQVQQHRDCLTPIINVVVIEKLRRCKIYFFVPSFIWMYLFELDYMQDVDH